MLTSHLLITYSKGNALFDYGDEIAKEVGSGSLLLEQNVHLCAKVGTWSGTSWSPEVVRGPPARPWTHVCGLTGCQWARWLGSQCSPTGRIRSDGIGNTSFVILVSA